MNVIFIKTTIKVSYLMFQDVGEVEYVAAEDFEESDVSDLEVSFLVILILFMKSVLQKDNT